MFKCRSMICWWLLELLTICAETIHSAAPKKAATERLVPIGSTTAFMCEPSFSIESSNATWYRNGQIVARVSSHLNAILRNRSRSNHEDELPEVGFLIIHNVTKEDEGIYYCRRDDDSKFGDVFNLRVAFVDPIPNNAIVQLHPKIPILGRSLMVDCPVPDAFPTPKISWTVNSLPISYISSDYTAFPNGTLLITHFSYHHFGFFECHITNFAGTSSANILVDSRDVTILMEPIQSSFINNCSAVLRSSLFMFLMGCIVTSSAFLIYIGCTVLFLKPSRRRRILRPMYWSRTDPRLAPGFRKTIVPLPDCFVNARMLPTSEA